MPMVQHQIIYSNPDFLPPATVYIQAVRIKKNSYKKAAAYLFSRLK